MHAKNMPNQLKKDVFELILYIKLKNQHTENKTHIPCKTFTMEIQLFACAVHAFLADISDGKSPETALDDFLKISAHFVRNCDKDVYLKEIEIIPEIGVRYLLQAIFEEIHGDVNCVKTYKLSTRNECPFACYRLAKVYHNHKIIYRDINMAMCLYYQYFGGTDRPSVFTHMLHEADDDFTRAFMDDNCAMINENSELKECVDNQNALIVNLQKRVDELEAGSVNNASHH